MQLRGMKSPRSVHIGPESGRRLLRRMARRWPPPAPNTAVLNGGAKQLPLPQPCGRLLAHVYCRNVEVVLAPGADGVVAPDVGLCHFAGLHLLAVGTYQAGKKFHVWQNLHWPAWIQSARMLTEVLKKKEAMPLQAQQQVPLMFVDVNPAQAVAEPPKNAKFYSDKSSLAANKQADKDSNVPKITGKQAEVVRTETVPREKFVPLQPAPPVQQPQKRRWSEAQAGLHAGRHDNGQTGPDASQG